MPGPFGLRRPMPVSQLGVTLGASRERRAGATVQASDIYYPSSAFVNNALLLNFNGADGSPTFTDSSPNALVPTVFGGAVLTTDPTKRTFGTAAGNFSASGSTYIRFAATSALSLPGAFTIRFTFIPASTGLTSKFLFGMSDGAHIWVNTNGGGFLECYVQGSQTTSSIIPQAGVKYHVVITKTSAGLKRWWIDGVLQPALNTDIGGMPGATSCEVGGAPSLAGGGTGYLCFMDGLQILPGVAVASVGVPAEEFTQPQFAPAA